MTEIYIPNSVKEQIQEEIFALQEEYVLTGAMDKFPHFAPNPFTAPISELKFWIEQARNYKPIQKTNKKCFLGWIFRIGRGK